MKRMVLPVDYYSIRSPGDTDLSESGVTMSTDTSDASNDSLDSVTTQESIHMDAQRLKARGINPTSQLGPQLVVLDDDDGDNNDSDNDEDPYFDPLPTCEELARDNAIADRRCAELEERLAKEPKTKAFKQRKFDRDLVAKGRKQVSY